MGALGFPEIILILIGGVVFLAFLLGCVLFSVALFRRVRSNRASLAGAVPSTSASNPSSHARPLKDTIECAAHGAQPATFVCQHLAASLATGEKVGFFAAEEPRGDAWCSTCEHVRLREGGASGDWSERSEAALGVKLLCGACYDRVRALQTA